jgi:sec-independent protein translocase protein TatC
MKNQMEKNTASFIEHLSELKNRLIVTSLIYLVAVGICYLFVEDIYYFLLTPLQQAMADGAAKKMIYTSLTEVFFTYLKLSFSAGFFIVFPFIAYQIYTFLSPGLYKAEKGVLLPFLIAVPILFMVGASLVYYFVFPLAWKFFLSFEVVGSSEVIAISLEAKVNEYLSLVTNLIISFGLAFQMPVILTLLVKFGVVSTDWLKRKRKVAVVIIFVLAAFLTPPDVISQIALALPMLLLYELSVIACKYISK